MEKQLGITGYSQIAKDQILRNYVISAKSIHIKDEIMDAVTSNRPVVALESTIISHGMPYPQNLEVANQLENLIRSRGAIPATIAIIDGIPKVGLTSLELQILAENQLEGSTERKKAVRKASRRDLAFMCANKEHAATTVSGTMILAHLAGISTFATGTLLTAHHIQ